MHIEIEKKNHYQAQLEQKITKMKLTHVNSVLLQSPQVCFFNKMADLVVQVLSIIMVERQFTIIMFFSITEIKELKMEAHNILPFCFKP